MLHLGYKKVSRGLFLDEDSKKVNILGNDYGFSQIIDCEIVEKNSSMTNSFGTTSGGINENGQISTYTNTYSSQSVYCKELYVNITVDDMLNPNIRLDVLRYGSLFVGSKKYHEHYNEANKIVSTLKLIMNKSKEVYIESGTINKVEHRYIEEKNLEERLKDLGNLYKDGILTEYEYTIKKQELLDKMR